MASVGRITNALGTAHNENTLALANINFDFSLYRYDAPPEFRALGDNISAKRRQEAERGSQHRTTRRLSALFEGVLPTIPEFSRTYGRRVSEISQCQKKTSQANSNGGPFAEHMGADGTAIWAAATSGPTAIPILLLCCLLARLWSGPEATSLWVELVEFRRREIEENCTGDSPHHFVLLQAAQQEISRSDLADWDASTRAWLQTADEVKQLQQTQLMLIVNNLQLPVSNNMRVYQSVIGSAKIALTSMENLLNGAAQRVQDGAFLLGLTTWHIYPDMIVHGSTTKEIKQKDNLVPVGSIITLGLQGDAELNQGIYWSLPLAHLRYYGDPVQASRSTGHDASRVSSDQLVYIALGALFNGWFKTSQQTPKGLRWLCNMYELFDRAAHTTLDDQDIIPVPGPGPILLSNILRQPGWLKMILCAAAAMCQLSESEKEKANKLIALGFRRYSKMLNETPSQYPPYFGLFRTQNLFPLLRTHEDCILILRNFAKANGLTGRDHIIRYKYNSLDNKTSHVGFATVDTLPLNDTNPSSWKPTAGTEHHKYRHKRWIALKWSSNESFSPSTTTEPGGLWKSLRKIKYAVCKCDDRCSSACPCEKFEDGCLSQCSCHKGPEMCASRRSRSHAMNTLEEEAALIQALGEDCVIEHPRLFIDHSRLHTKVWIKSTSEFPSPLWPHHPPFFFHTPESQDYSPRKYSIRQMSTELYVAMRNFYRNMWNAAHFEEGLIWHLQDAPWLTTNDSDTSPVILNPRFGIPGRAALYHVSKTPLNLKTPFKSEDVAEEELQQLFHNDRVDITKLKQYLAELGITGQRNQDSIISLKVLSSLVTIYENLPGASIALTVASKPLHQSSFIKQNIEYSSKIEKLGGAIVETSSDSDVETSSDGDVETLSVWGKGENRNGISSPWFYKLDLARKFSCIAFCEFGAHSIDPTSLFHVFAMSSRNSIFVAAPLLDDPGKLGEDPGIRRVMGNIGRAGIAMMIAPTVPRIRPLKTDNWELINHSPFDGKSTDSFHNTSLHLSFTRYTMPVDTGTHGGQDTETYLIETLVSIHDRDRWVADIDALSLFRSDLVSQYRRTCSHESANVAETLLSSLITIDNWEELLDREHMNYVVRAHQNSKARLATTIISANQGHSTRILVDEPCWPCILNSSTEPTTYIQ